MDGGARKMIFSTFPKAGSRLQVRAQKRAEVLMWVYGNSKLERVDAKELVIRPPPPQPPLLQPPLLKPPRTTSNIILD